MSSPILSSPASCADAPATQVDGLTYPEIAQRLGVSVSSVQQYMVRAMSACYAAFHD